MMNKLIEALKVELARQDKDWSWMDDKRGHIEISEGVGDVLVDGCAIIRAILTALKEPTPGMLLQAKLCNSTMDERDMFIAMLDEAMK
tara:strand:- start:800 stop:1063 length:264 start_codon:yes stop_codon:yes gene_type:complete